MKYPEPETGIREKLYDGAAIITFADRPDIVCIEFQNSVTKVPRRSYKPASGFLRKGDYTYIYFTKDAKMVTKSEGK